jgi:transcriptional regulator with XRE-family HTH domain
LEPEVAFGQVLRELRQGRQLSQEVLALDSGLERNYISLLELGRNSATVKTMFKLAPVLGISVGEFMTLVETRAKQKRPSKTRQNT